MQKFKGMLSGIANFFNSGGRFLISVPGILISGSVNVIRYFVWPKERRRRYRTVLFTVFLFAFLAANLDYPIYWNRFADWANPKLDAVDMPDSVRRLDRWGALRTLDEALNLPYFWDVPFSQGLDLRGGIHLIYSADLSGVRSRDRGESMDGLRDVIERRVNLFGVREPQVVVENANGEYRLIVELAGIQDFNTAIDIIGQTPYLEFKELREFEDQKRILEQVVQGELTDKGFENICANATPELIRLATQETGEDPCFTSTGLTGKYLKSATVQFSGGGGGGGSSVGPSQPIISLELDDEGSKIFEEVTERNIGKPLAIYLDGILRSAPTIQNKISGGRAQITGFDIEQSKQIARDLNAGALPVPINLISQQSIGASLGEESLRDSLRAGILGAIAVIIFMITIYRLSGFLAVISLGIYLSLFLAILKLIPVTLTLPGIAGLILSIGMAVDANILVFERLREEMTKETQTEGNDFLLMLNHAYERAWSSIRDGNISTLLTSGILFWFSTSFIKGFALTLGIGILVSMFSVMIVTKYLMRFAGEGRFGKKIALWIR